MMENEEAPAAPETEPDEASPEDGGAADDELPEVEDTRTYLKGLIEALIFVSDSPLSLKDLARAARLDRKRTWELVRELEAEFSGKGVELVEVGGGYAFRSNPQYARYVRKLLEARPVRLSRAQLETLAIVAYRQPITRPEADEVRGVDCGPVLKGLLERDLIRILGKKDEPGRPLLYGTTVAFLELFGLQSLRQLPTLREFSELTDESKRDFERETGEQAPEGTVVSDEDPDLLDAPAADDETPGSDTPPADSDGDDDDDDDEDDDEDEDEDDDDDDDDDD